jgi:hypothetical protein
MVIELPPHQSSALAFHQDQPGRTPGNTAGSEFVRPSPPWHAAKSHPMPGVSQPRHEPDFLLCLPKLLLLATRQVPRDPKFGWWRGISPRLRSSHTHVKHGIRRLATCHTSKANKARAGVTSSLTNCPCCFACRHHPLLVPGRVVVVVPGAGSIAAATASGAAAANHLRSYATAPSSPETVIYTLYVPQDVAVRRAMPAT